MKSNKQMTQREFNYSHELKVAINALTKVTEHLDLAKDAATSRDSLFLARAHSTLETLKTTIKVALREMEYDS